MTRIDPTSLTDAEQGVLKDCVASQRHRATTCYPEWPTGLRHKTRHDFMYSEARRITKCGRLFSGGHLQLSNTCLSRTNGDDGADGYTVEIDVVLTSNGREWAASLDLG